MAEAAEREAFAAMGETGNAELAAVKAWIASDCEGRQLRPHVEERQRLADKLMAALAADGPVHNAATRRMK